MKDTEERDVEDRIDISESIETKDKIDGVLINIVGQPVKSELLCYYTGAADDKIILFRLMRNWYRRTDTDVVLQDKIESERLASAKRNSQEAAAWVLLEAANKAIRY
jgi:hypothetical protein